MTVVSEESAFDNVIAVIGNDGPYQKRFNLIFNFVLVILASMPYLNIVIALAVPDHWCNVPGRDLTNYTLDEWRELYIPRENDTRGKMSYSKCKMFNHSLEDNSNLDIIDCQFGWEFDKTWYTVTAPSKEEWVCDKTLHVTNAFVFARIGEVVGTFFFGQLADIIGRRPVFFITVVTIVFGRSLSVVTSGSVYLFFLAAFVGSLPSTSVFQGPLVIAMEISKSADRAHIAMMQCLGWTIGLCLMPFIMWFVGDWRYFMLITTLPCILFLFSRSFIIESPRWLASKGRISDCINELKQIAKVNKTKVPDNAMSILKKNCGHSEKVYGVLGLFSSWRLTKNTLLLVTDWSITVLIYFILTLNINNLGGNPFLNYFWQGLAEVPAYILGKYASDKFGRRFTNLIAFTGTFLGCIPIIYVIQDEKYAIAVAAISVYLKFSISFAFFVVNLQSLETYPTCIRQTGISIGGIMGNAFGILGPYVVYLGTSVNATYPYVLAAILCAIASVAGIFLPETLNQKLPETLAEAEVFGANQTIWGVPKKSIILSDAEEPLKKHIIE